MHRTLAARFIAGVAIISLTLAACSSGGGASAAPSTGGDSSPAASEGSAEKGTVSIAINPWVGAEANVAVVKVLLEQLGYTVKAASLAEEIAWPGFETGEICKELAITATHFWVLLYRARMALRQCLDTNWFAK